MGKNRWWLFCARHQVRRVQTTNLKMFCWNAVESGGYIAWAKVIGNANGHKEIYNWWQDCF